MEKQGFCSHCNAVHFALTFKEFHALRIFLSDVLYRDGKLSAPPEVCAFDQMLQDINDEFRKGNR